MILDDAKQKLMHYNKLRVHYNLVADGVYSARNSCPSLFSEQFLPFLIAGLISFDMQRMMGSGAATQYDPSADGFAARLMGKLESLKSCLNHLVTKRISEIDLDVDGEAISSAYCLLASSGAGCLNQKGDEFHVGATKILHFLVPDLFVIVDRNACRAFREAHGVSYRNSTQPGYTPEKYLECLRHCQSDIASLGADGFLALEHGTPMARIYDKLLFSIGLGWS
jgi:hypothetical protein